MDTIVAAAEAIAQMSRPPDSITWRGHEGRTLAARWVIATHPDGTTGVVDLTISHWKAPHQAYVAHLNHVEVGNPGPGGLVGELSSPMDAIKVWTTKAPRYNRTKHAAFADQAIAAVRNVDNPLHPRIVAKFDRATRKHH
ncbi:MAG: hypothetical protein H7Y15_18515 [Pseudonocardia sp.]|nr:hypothetical protein [Pseudonocardia sp.]